jgi:GT2 family glycosyltransferase
MEHAARTPHIIAVVVMYDSGPAAIACARGLLAQEAIRIDVIIVDNGSADDSFVLAHDEFTADDRVVVARVTPNRGFSGGANEGMSRALEAGADYVWLVTDDLELDSRAGAALVAAMEQDANIGLAGPYVYFADDRDRIYFGGGRLGPDGASHEHAGEVAGPSVAQGPVRDTGYVTGSSMFLRADALQDVGLMDESFWLYFEDADLSWRIRASGRRVVVLPSARAWHDATPSSDKTMRVRMRYAYRNELRFLRKHHLRRAPEKVWENTVTSARLAKARDARARPLLLGTIDFLLGRSGPIKGSW